MPQARGGDARSTSSARTSSGRARSKRAAAGSTASAGRGASSRSGALGSSSSSEARSAEARTSANSAEAYFDSAAKRIRSLNERIIQAGKQTGETTLSSYEKALKTIAAAVEHGPGRSDIDWIAQLATAQAKFIREVTEAWTSAAREMLK